MKKRGISPLIATVLLIAFVIVLATIVINWGSSIVKKSQQEATIECLSIELDIIDACYDESFIYLTIENKKDKTIDKGFTLREEGSIDTKLLESLPNTPTLGPFEIKKIQVTLDSDIGELKKVIIIPKIESDGKIMACPKAMKSYENVPRCES